MIYFPIFAAILTLGIYRGTSLYSRRFRTVNGLMALANERMARDFCRCAEHMDAGYCHNPHAWKQIGGPVGLWKMYRQALVWSDIVEAIANETPSFAEELEDLRHQVMKLEISIVACCWEAFRAKFRPETGRPWACTCIKHFAEIVKISESVTLVFDANHNTGTVC